MGECLLSRVGELSQELCHYVKPDSVARLEVDKAELIKQFELLSQDIDAALEYLTHYMAAALQYQTCLNDVQTWLTKAETDVAEILSRIELCKDPAVHLDQLRALLVEMERNHEKLDEFGKCCGIAEAKQLHDCFHERYKDLINNLKVLMFDVLHYSIIFMHLIQSVMLDDSVARCIYLSVSVSCVCTLQV